MEHQLVGIEFEPCDLLRVESDTQFSVYFFEWDLFFFGMPFNMML